MGFFCESEKAVFSNKPPSFENLNLLPPYLISFRKDPSPW